MTNTLSKPTLLVRVPSDFSLKTSYLTRHFRCFTLTETERDVEVMPGGSYDDIDGLRSDMLPLSSALSSVLHVRQI